MLTDIAPPLALAAPSRFIHDAGEVKNQTRHRVKVGERARAVSNKHEAVRRHREPRHRDSGGSSGFRPSPLTSTTTRSDAPDPSRLKGDRDSRRKSDSNYGNDVSHVFHLRPSSAVPTS